jgi:hypothetical protein
VGLDTPFPYDKYRTLASLALEVIRNFSSRSLSAPRTLGTGAVARPLEALFRDEFYAALRRVLRFAVKVTSEWSGDKGGRIDFRITDPKWGVALLRDGDGLREHCEMFKDGAYKTLILKGWLTDWLILDCRSTMPTAYGMMPDFPVD